MPVSGLHHVSLPTLRADVDAEVDFWRLLGLSVVMPPATLAERATWLQAPDGTQIHLLYVDPGGARERGGHVALVAPAPFDEVIAALEAAGHPTEPRTQHWGAARSYVRTPGGHLVELMAAPPPPSER